MVRRVLADRDVVRDRAQLALGQARRLAEQGARDVADATTRGLQGMSQRVGRRAGRSVTKHENAAADKSEGPKVEDVAMDVAAYLTTRQRKADEQLGHANILISGQTGAGKSTLINAVFRVPLAEEGTGKPVTKDIQRYDVPGVPVSIYDTRGIELGDTKKRVIRDYRKAIAGSRKGGPDSGIHVAWYCINSEQARVQDYDTDVVRALADEVPVILVLTQCIDDGRPRELEAAIEAEDLPIEGGPILTLARERRIAGQPIPPRGLEELVERTNDILPEAVKRAFINAQGVVIRLKANQAHTVVGACAAAAAAIGATPIPAPDAAVLAPLQVGMLASINAIFGMDTGSGSSVKLIRGLLGQGGMAVVGKQIAANLLNVIPGVAVINATVAAALTAALGEAYIQLCTEILRRQAEGKPMPAEDMLPFLLDAYQKAFQKPRNMSRAKRGRAN